MFQLNLAKIQTWFPGAFGARGKRGARLKAPLYNEFEARPPKHPSVPSSPPLPSGIGFPLPLARLPRAALWEIPPPPWAGGLSGLALPSSPHPGASPRGFACATTSAVALLSQESGPFPPRGLRTHPAWHTPPAPPTAAPAHSPFSPGACAASLRGFWRRPAGPFLPPTALLADRIAS